MSRTSSGSAPSAPDAPLTPTRVTLPDVALSVLDVGHGPVALLLHGFPDRASMWRTQIAALVAAGYRVVAPDLRGFGDSDRPEEPGSYRTERVVGDVLALLDALGIERAAVVGHDWGAAVGWALVLSSSRVDAFAALTVGHPNAFRVVDLHQRALSWYTLWFQWPGVAEELLPADDWALFRRWAHPATPDDALVRAQIADLSRPGALTAALGLYRDNVDPRAFIGGEPLPVPPVTCPVLGVIGTEDIGVGTAQMVDTARHVSGPFECVTVPGGDHWLPVRSSALIDEQLVAFLGRMRDRLPD